MNKKYLVEVTIDFVPNTEEEFEKWCKKYDFDCFGLEFCRRGWCDRFNTYLRDAIGVASTKREEFLVYEDDLVEVENVN